MQYVLFVDFLIRAVSPASMLIRFGAEGCRPALRVANTFLGTGRVQVTRIRDTHIDTQALLTTGLPSRSSVF